MMQETLLIALTLNKKEQLKKHNKKENVEKEVIELLALHEEKQMILENTLTANVNGNSSDLRNSKAKGSNTYDNLRDENYIKGDI